MGAGAVGGDLRRHPSGNPYGLSILLCSVARKLRCASIKGPGPTANEQRRYPVNSSKDILSFMTEIDVGLDWQFCNRWSARVGYRVLFVSGIGLAEEQITPYAVDIPEIAHIDHNATLILHGAFAGLTYNF